MSTQKGGSTPTMGLTVSSALPGRCLVAGSHQNRLARTHHGREERNPPVCIRTDQSGPEAHGSKPGSQLETCPARPNPTQNTHSGSLPREQTHPCGDSRVGSDQPCAGPRRKRRNRGRETVVVRHARTLFRRGYTNDSSREPRLHASQAGVRSQKACTRPAAANAAIPITSTRITRESARCTRPPARR